MAEIDNDETGPSRTAARVEICYKVPVPEGPWPMVALSSVALNAELGVVLAHVSLWLGEQELCGHDVLLFGFAIREWVTQVKALASGEWERNSVAFSMDNPELMMTARHYPAASSEGGDGYYELLVALDSGVFDPDKGLSGTGPGVLLAPEREVLLQFAEALLAEAEEALNAA